MRESLFLECNLVVHSFSKRHIISKESKLCLLAEATYYENTKILMLQSTSHLCALY